MRRIENPLCVVVISIIMIGVGLVMLGLSGVVYTVTHSAFYSAAFQLYGVYLVARYGLKLREDMPLVMRNGEKD